MQSETWQSVRLGDCGQLRNGVNFNAAQEGIGLPVLKVKDFQDRYFVPKDGLDELDSSRIRVPADQFVEDGDTIIIRSNGNGALVGRCLYATGLHRPITFSGFCIRFRPHPDRVDPRFASYLLRSSVCRNRFVAFGSGTGIQNLNQAAIANTEIDIPHLAEQRAIARILGALDDKIELNRQMNATLEGMTQALFKSWFVDFDPVTAKGAGRPPFGMSADLATLFPGRFVDSRIGPIPQGWSPGAISGIARYVNGRNFTKGASGVGHMVIRIAELNSGPTGSTVYNSVDAALENTALPGDILFAWSGSLDVYRWYRDAALINQHIFKVVCDEFPEWLVHQHLVEAMPFFQGIAADKATTMGHIKREHLQKAEIAIPPNDLLAAVGPLVTPMYDRWLENARESLQIEAVRDAILPQLLSGEIRLPHAEKLVEEVA